MMDEINVFGQDNSDSGLSEPLLTKEEYRQIKTKKTLASVINSPNLKFDLERYDRNGNLIKDNTRILDFIRSFGVDNYEDFIINYIDQLHPFMIMSEMQRSNNHFVCVIDASYGIPLWIECYTNQFNEQIFSFHELNRYNKSYESGLLLY